MRRPALALALVPLLSASAVAAPSIDARIAAAVEAMREKLCATRRDLHQHPELSNREARTGKLVADRLRALGIEVRAPIAHTGVIGLLRGGRPGGVIALRADMDALPIDETLEVPYRSQTKGVKHACGHDAHTTILLGVAEVLASLRAELPGTVKLIFQPAEEGIPDGEDGGAPLVIKEGGLDDPRPQAIFGLHAWPLLPVGHIGYASGPAMAAADRFVITIHGKKTHGASPHLGVDAVVVAAEVVGALQVLRARNVNPSAPMVLSIGMIHGGNRFNIIADEVQLEGTVRTLDETVRTDVKARTKRILDGITAAHGAGYTMRYEESAALTRNDPALVAESLAALRRALGAGNVMPSPPHMGAEDFAYYQRVIPGFFFFLGVANEKKGIGAMLHTPDFDIDEEALGHGTRALSTLAFDYLTRHAKAPKPR